MTADPKPDDLAIFQQAESSVAQGHTNRINRFSRVHPLELQTGMPRILAKQGVGFACEISNVAWQFTIRRPESRRCTRPHSLSESNSVVLPAARSARTSAASFASASLEASNWRVQCSSSRSSSSSHSATRSCSSAGSVASLAITSSSARVMERVYPTTTGRPNIGLEPSRRCAVRSCRRGARLEPRRWADKTLQSDGFSRC